MCCHGWQKWQRKRYIAKVEMSMSNVQDNLNAAVTKLEELIAEFHGTARFGWYEGHLQQVVEDIRRHEEVDQWLRSRKELGKQIDPATAEATSMYGQIVDPYGVERVPPDFDCVGRNYFYRNPGSEWVWDGDIPKATLTRLRDRSFAGQESNDEMAF
jgi:hypothetical protein